MTDLETMLPPNLAHEAGISPEFVDVAARFTEEVTGYIYTPEGSEVVPPRMAITQIDEIGRVHV